MNKPISSANQKNFARLLCLVLPHVLMLSSVALVLSAIMTWANVGFGEEFLSRWGRSFVSSLVVLPMVLVCIGALEKLVDAIFPSMHRIGRMLAVSLLTACAIESVLALAATAINNPWDHTFGHFWWVAFSRSLPVGIVIGLFMGFYMKPKMDRMNAARRTAQA